MHFASILSFPVQHLKSNFSFSFLKHIVKAPSAGYVHGLHLAAGQQVSDGSVLFSVKVSHLLSDTIDIGRLTEIESLHAQTCKTGITGILVI